MGTMVSYAIGEVVIPGDKIDDAVKALVEHMVYPHEMHEHPVTERNDIVLALGEEGFDSELGEDGTLTLTDFSGEKYYDSQGELLAKLAPFVAPHEHAFIDGMTDWGDYYWRWRFVDGKLLDLPGHLVYQHEDGTVEE